MGAATMRVFGFAFALIATPAMAVTSTNGPIWPDCSDVRLQQAVGVRGAGDHSYRLAGTCKHVFTRYVDGKKTGVTEVGRAFLEIDALWVASENEFMEKGTFSGEESGNLGFHTKFKCSDDPYIKPTTCTVVNHSNNTGWPDLSHSALQKQQPLGAGRTTFEEASARSTEWNAPPPPPPPHGGAAEQPVVTGKSFRKVKQPADNDVVVSTPAQQAGVQMSAVGVVALESASRGRIAPSTAQLLQGATSTGPVPSKQDMTKFGPGWQNGDQLFWRAGKPGQNLKLPFTATTTGRHHVVASFTMAADYGIVQPFLNGQAIGEVVNLYSKSVSLTGPRVLGTVTVQAGQNSLVLWAVGKDQRSRGHFVGLDEVELIPVP
jgi:hypothetical protein